MRASLLLVLLAACGSTPAPEPAAIPVATNAPGGDDVGAGAAAFERCGCRSCHDGGIAPDLRGILPGDVAFADGTSLHLDGGSFAAFVRESIAEPNAHVHAGYSPIMPVYRDDCGVDGLNVMMPYLRCRASGAPGCEPE